MMSFVERIKSEQVISSACVLRATTKKRSSTFFEEKVHPGDVAAGFSDLYLAPLLHWCKSLPAQTSIEQVILCGLFSVSVFIYKKEQPATV